MHIVFSSAYMYLWNHFEWLNWLTIQWISFLFCWPALLYALIDFFAVFFIRFIQSVKLFVVWYSCKLDACRSLTIAHQRRVCNATSARSAHGCGAFRNVLKLVVALQTREIARLTHGCGAFRNVLQFVNLLSRLRHSIVDIVELLLLSIRNSLYFLELCFSIFSMVWIPNKYNRLFCKEY